VRNPRTLARKRIEEDLRQAVEELDRTHRANDEFLATLAHELRNPLMALRMAVQVIKSSTADSQAILRSVELMEGQIQSMTRMVDDLVDGSRVAQGSAVAQAPEPKAELPTPRRVLVVDDNPATTEFQAQLLRLAGHEVRIVHDGPAALSIAVQFRPHVVLLDLGLPGSDGFEVARALRSYPETEASLLVAITGFSRDGDRSAAQEAGFDHYLVKPADPETVLALVASAPAYE
jgi:CheY-like chemotaxis protein